MDYFYVMAIIVLIIMTLMEFDSSYFDWCRLGTFASMVLLVVLIYTLIPA